MTPQPWSHSRLDDFKNCPRAFYEKQIAKSVTETKGEATLWGERVHEMFEKFLADGEALPHEVAMHEPFLLRLLELPYEHRFVEQRIALNTAGNCCEFFDQDVWYRGVIDFGVVDRRFARLVDHKTGKHHSKFGQLRLFALWLFERYPDVEAVRCEYYWTQSMTTNGETYTRDQIPKLWSHFIPDLKQYAEAFKTDTWQPRQSGLCNGWCPVTDCEFWRPKRKRA
jgi:hypothetical protein